MLLQSCPTLRDPMDCILPGSSAHGMLQAKVLEWVAMPFSRGSSSPRAQTCVSYCSCIAGRFFFFLMLSHQGSPALGETYQKLTLIPKRSDYRFFFLLSLLFSDFQYAYVLLYQIHICFLPFTANIFKKWRELNLSAFRMRVTEHLFSPENYTKPRRTNQESQPPLV